MLFKPCLQTAFKLGFAAVFERQSQPPKCSACFSFRVARQVTADGFDLMELAKLHGNLGKHLRQTAPSVANYALYFNEFGFQTAYGLGVKGVSFVFDFDNGQSLFADAVEQNHDAECAAEVGGVYHNVGAGWRDKLCFGGGGRLCCGLFACGITMPQLLRIDVFTAAETFAATVAFVTLPAVLFAVFFDLF